jgi:DNA-binding CsgD family transcriptional regulator
MIRPRTGPTRCIDACVISQALDGMCIGLTMLDLSGRISWANRAALSVLGKRLSECEGKPLGQVLKDPQFSAFWHEAEPSPEGVMGEVKIHWPRAATLKANLTHCFDQSGNRIGRALLFCDVTAERMLQVQLSSEATEALVRAATTVDGAAEPETTGGLTTQELKVLRLVGQGLGNTDIARRLFIAPSTVRSHMKQIYRKTGLKTRSEAVRYANTNGLSPSLPGASCGA